MCHVGLASFLRASQNDADTGDWISTCVEDHGLPRGSGAALAWVLSAGVRRGVVVQVLVRAARCRERSGTPTSERRATMDVRVCLSIFVRAALRGDGGAK